LLQACQCDFNGRLGWAERPYDSPRLLLAVLDAVRSVDAGAIAAACTDKAKIPERIRSARVGAVKAMLDQAREGDDEG
jgi:tRNA nucleotidyltransferase (CCA-adding enzyme)